MRLDSGWTLVAAPAGTIPSPADLRPDLLWQEAPVPGTVAQALELGWESTRDLDAEDWWYRCTFPRPQGDDRHRLRCEGLATFADVWLNGTPLLESRNMFRPANAEVTQLLQDTNELVIRFRALAPELAAKRPRPRWKTALVAHQNLRWVRTTLLGRIPGWTPPLTPVGPWRPVHLEPAPIIEVEDLQTWAEGGEGRLRLKARGGEGLMSATLQVGAQRFDLTLQGTELSADLRIPNVPLWWPHTHGEPQLLDCALGLRTSTGSELLDLGRVGFRAIAMDRREGRVQMVVNGQPLFCRGACWTVADLRSLGETGLREALELAKAAGFNLLRVGGTMTYESDTFYALCDELGLMVWQDFMFANMDYPFADEVFRTEVDAEVEHQLNRLQRHPCVATYCGGSEVEQQAAMLGLPPSEWSDPFFAEHLPARCAARHPGVPYFPSTPCEGALPFHVATGITHYYGVGAYLRPLEELKHAGVKFTPECLGFSNVPEAETLALLDDVPPHHPAWKARVPRDSGAGWDFEDVRDHYLRALFKVDPVSLRSFDLERYLALSRAVSGEVMTRAFAEWRQPGSGCGGALVWFYKDLWPGAGWGLMDSENRPKAAYWHLRRALAPRTLLLTDEGLDGVRLHAFNDGPEAMTGTVELELLQEGRTCIGRASAPVQVPAHGALSLQGDAILAHFMDTTYAYRFGPPKHDIVVARLRDASGAELGGDALFPNGHGLPRQDLTLLRASASMEGEQVRVELASDAFIQGLSFACKGFTPSDNHFHLAPGAPKVLRFRREPGSTTPFKAYVAALNLRGTLTLRAES